MESVKVKGKEIKFYSEIGDLPIGRYNLFNLYLLQDSGIGSDFTAIVQRFSALDLQLQNEQIEEARIERRNLQALFFGLFEGINYKQRAYACLIAEIGGEPCEDISESGISEIVKKLERLGLTQKEVTEKIDEKKKSSRPLWPFTFPSGLKPRG